MGEWKERALKRRDERSTKAPEGPTRSKKKKSTRQWCRGIKGREHLPECQTDDSRPYLHNWRFLVCTQCGKRLDYWTGPKSLLGGPNPKPAWVTD